jgi:DNA topoisomerase-1
MVQIGTVDDEDKPTFASLSPDQQLTSITYEEAMDLFQLPKSLGTYEDEPIEVNNGRFGPYVKFGTAFVSLPKGTNPLDVELDQAIELIKEKQKADAPIYMYKDLPVQKGKGRFGPFIKWNNIFINVNKKYDWDNLSDTDIVTLVEEKIQKEIDKVIHNWEDEGIRVEKARWGRHNIIKGKVKIELPKTVDVPDRTLEEAQAGIEKNAPKKKAAAKKKAPAKKKTATKKKTTTKKKAATKK